MRKNVAAAAIAGSLLAGGAVGAIVFGPNLAGAQSSTTTPQPPAGATPNAGTFKGNEDPAHETTESPQREADEDAGRAFQGRGAAPNEDAAHEATEGSQREAEENARQAASTTTTQPNG